MTAVLLVTYGTLSESQRFRQTYWENDPLNLPGAGRIRLDREIASEIHWLVENLRAYADTFVSLPGLNSFYLWAELEPPTGLNAGSWSYLLDDAQQRAIINAIANRHGVCAIVAPLMEQTWYIGEAPKRTVLVEYIDDAFKPFAQTVHYTFKVRNERDTREMYVVLLQGSRTIGVDDPAVPMPQDFAPVSGPFTLELKFATTKPGALAGTQTRKYPVTPVRKGWRPILYIGEDGRLRSAPFEGGDGVITAQNVVTDGASHQAMIVVTDAAWSLYIDGELAGAGGVPEDVSDERYWQLGDAYCADYPEAPAGWFSFSGTIADARLWQRALTEEEIHARFEKY